MLHRYGNIEYVMKLPFGRAVKLIKKCADEAMREKFYMQWLMYLPLMTKDTYISFEEFYQSTQVTIDRRPKDEIMKEILGKGK